MDEPSIKLTDTCVAHLSLHHIESFTYFTDFEAISSVKTKKNRGGAAYLPRK